ncbi:SAICAR synthase-like protein [Stemphylium lycopersici]|nr:SAICAR synthase-like protein [Stemphylium lycopersici]
MPPGLHAQLKRGLAFDDFHLRPEDVIEEPPIERADAEQRAAKRRRVEAIAAQYLRGRPPVIVTAGLRGPFDHGWQNPWAKPTKGKRRPGSGKSTSTIEARPGTKAKVAALQGDATRRRSSARERRREAAGAPAQSLAPSIASPETSRAARDDLSARAQDDSLRHIEVPPSTAALPDQDESEASTTTEMFSVNMDKMDKSTCDPSPMTNPFWLRRPASARVNMRKANAHTDASPTRTRSRHGHAQTEATAELRISFPKAPIQVRKSPPKQDSPEHWRSSASASMIISSPAKDDDGNRDETSSRSQNTFTLHSTGPSQRSQRTVPIVTSSVGSQTRTPRAGIPHSPVSSKPSQRSNKAGTKKMAEANGPQEKHTRPKPRAVNFDSSPEKTSPVRKHARQSSNTTAKTTNVPQIEVEEAEIDQVSTVDEQRAEKATSVPEESEELRRSCPSRDSEWSTQAAMVRAQLEFQQSTFPALSPAAVREESQSPMDTPRRMVAVNSPVPTPLSAFTVQRDEPLPDESLFRGVPVSTQDLFGAASPFAFSTVKKKAEESQRSNLKFAISPGNVGALEPSDGTNNSPTPSTDRIPLKEKNTTSFWSFISEKASQGSQGSLADRSRCLTKDAGFPHLNVDTSLDDFGRHFADGSHSLAPWIRRLQRRSQCPSATAVALHANRPGPPPLLALRCVSAAPNDRILANLLSARPAISATHPATRCLTDGRINVEPMSPQPDAQGNTSPPASVRSNASHEAPDSAAADRDALTPKSLSQTGRSRTAPIVHENNLWKSSIDRPQLDERDSIFATTYLASDSPISSPRTSARTVDKTNDAPEHSLSEMAAPAPPQRRLVDPPIVRRKHSTLPPTNSIDHHAVLTTPFNPRTAIATGLALESARHSPPPYMSPVDSPVQRPVTPQRQELHSTLQDAFLESEERRRNREWREGKPVPFKGNVILDTPVMDVEMEKKIEATLAKTEQPTSARSRKASHYLRVFKDGDPSEEPKKKDKTKERLSAERTLSTLSEEGPAKCAATETSHLTEQLRRASLASSVVQSPLAGPVDSYFDTKPSPRIDIGPASTPPLYTNARSDGSSSDKHQLPRRLLEDIRGFGNLTPGAGKRSSFSRSLPTAAVEKVHAHAPTNGAPHYHEPSDYLKTKEASKAEHTPGSEEEEESEKEQISSALYFPHRRLKTNEQAPKESQNQSREVKAVEKRASIHESARPKSWIAEKDVQTPEEVEISLQSKDTNQCLHGDISTATSVNKDKDQPLTSTVDTLSAESETESLAESTQSLLGYESSATDDLGTTPTATTHKQEPKAAPAGTTQPPAPLGAVELKPYDHQVGGHSTVYRFSRRAVCKQLNNRENEFYETVERQHPELLEFLPRYIGVLNVTYRKAPKKKKIAKDKAKQDTGPATSATQSENASRQTSTAPQDPTRQETTRMVSHSQQIMPTPQVIFENNRHIIPDNLFRVPPRSTTPDPWMRNTSYLSQQHRRYQSDYGYTQRSASRPPLQHTSSWGVTTINRKLQEEVLRQVFAPPTIHHRPRHHHHHGLPSRKAGDPQQSMVGSAPTIRRNSTDVATLQQQPPPSEECTRKQVLKAEARRYASGGSADTVGADASAGSAPNVEALKPPQSTLPRRRHSGSGLTRRPLGIDTVQRHNLEYYEEDGYGGDAEEEVFKMDEDPKASDQDRGRTLHSSRTPKVHQAQEASEGTMLPAPVVPSDIGAPLSEEPNNPDNALQQSDERVQHFILLEDLTAGMSKPCVLDLKMGTRQYGIEADDKKQRSQRRKCQMTTSRELGVRVCGMQIWNVKTQSYVFEDKYFGRDLKAGKEFQDALKRFFWDGTGYKAATRHIPVILEKISQLERMIKNLPGYRFYASSLLMLYDRGDGDSKEKDGLPPSQSNGHSNMNGEDPAAISSGLTSPGPGVVPNPSPKKHPEIKLKIVDFANCVTAEDPLPDDLPCPPENPDGIDRGYLRGLRSLRLYFQRIWHDINEEWVERGEGEGMARNHHHGPGLGEVGAGWMDDAGGEETGYLQELYDSPYTGAITTRTSLLNGFPHDSSHHQFAFYNPNSFSTSAPNVDHAGDATTTGSLNTLGYSPHPLSTYLDYIKTISDSLSDLPKGCSHYKPVIISVTGTVEEAVQCYRLISTHQSSVRMVLAMELNLSCPNIPGKPPPAYSSTALLSYLVALKAEIGAQLGDRSHPHEGHVHVPVGIKTPPYTYADQFQALIDALLDSKKAEPQHLPCPVSFITAVNTLGSSLLLAPHVETSNTDKEHPHNVFRHTLESANGTGVGGLAGKPLHPLALGNVYTIKGLLFQHEALEGIQIIGVGGVDDQESFRRMRSVGASAVGVGTALGRKGVRVFEEIGTAVQGS